MRFDEFVKLHGIAVTPVDRFDGLAVEVEGPPGWEHFDSALGGRIWICRTDPRISDFCANAVLTMHRVEASLDAGEVFAMLAEQQLQSVQGCHELHRTFADAPEGPGTLGTLAMQITHERGTLDSESQSRIITTEKEMRIAQLTVTGLHDSPVDRSNVRLSARRDATVPTDGAAGPASTRGHDSAPIHGRAADGR